MKITKSIGSLVLIISIGFGSDNFIEHSQKNNQEFLNEKIKERYYDRNDLNLKGQVAAILEFDSLSDTLHKNKSLTEIDDPKSTIELIKHQMKSEEIDFFRFNNGGQAICRLNYLYHKKYENQENLYEYKFNIKGQLIELDGYDFNLKREKYERYKYDRVGKLIDVKSKSQPDRFINKTQFIYEDEYMIVRYNNHQWDSLDFGENKYKNGYYIEQAEIDLIRNKQYDE